VVCIGSFSYNVQLEFNFSTVHVKLPTRFLVPAPGERLVNTLWNQSGILSFRRSP